MKIQPLYTCSLIILVISCSSIFANEGKTSDEKKSNNNDKNAEERSLLLDPPVDQLAVESSHGYSHVIAPAPQAIPVPLPLPVNPAKIVLPSLPTHSGGGPPIKYRRTGGFNSKLHAPPPPPPPPRSSPPRDFPKIPLTRSNYPSPVANLPPPQKPFNIPKPSDNIYDSSQDSRSHVANPPPFKKPDFVPPPPFKKLPPPPPHSIISQNEQSHNIHQAQSPPSDYSGPKSNDIIGDSSNNQGDIHDGEGSVNSPSYASAPSSIQLGPSSHGGAPNIFNSQPQSFGRPQSFGPPKQPLASALTSYNQNNPLNEPIVSGAAYPQTQIRQSNDLWPPTNNADMPQIVNINVKCEKNLMKVNIDFDGPFYGIIFSKGHYNNANCVHLPAGAGHKTASFNIAINVCGTLGNTDNGLYGYGQQSGSGTFFENTLIIQYDPQVQEVWDQARKLRCTWHDQYEKSVTFRPFPVDMLNVVRADFAGDNVGCWLQIQEGKGPWASEVSGLVKIGQTMTMVLAIKDDDNKFDMMVRNCVAHDGKRAPIQLVDQRGCVTRPKLMSKFVKIKNFGASASGLSYAYFQAFKFPDSMEVHFQCTIQICRYQCPEQCSGAPHGQGSNQSYEKSAVVGEPRYNNRRKRSANATEVEQDIGVNRIIQVVSTRDLGFLIDKKEIIEEFKKTEKDSIVSENMPTNLICMSISGFSATLVVLLSILIISCLLSAFLCLRFRGSSDTQSIISSYENPLFFHRKSFFS